MDRAEFIKEYDMWNEAVKYYSDLGVYLNNQHFRNIVNAGKSVVPFIMEKISFTPDMIVMALDEIFENEVSIETPLKSRVNAIERHCHNWLSWYDTEAQQLADSPFAKGKWIAFPGSFDPFTKGHEQLVKKSLEIFDGILILVSDNSQKNHCAPLEKRCEFIANLFGDDANIVVRALSGSVIQYVRARGIKYVFRGVRDSYDMEYERKLTEFNKRKGGVETVMMFSDPEFAWISSSSVRECIRLEIPYDDMLPERGLLDFHENYEFYYK